MTLDFSLDVNAIDRIIKQLEERKKRIKEKANEIARRLAEIGVEYAQLSFDASIYDGIKDNHISLVKRRSGYSVVASGKTVLFIEFGTGVTYPDNHPKAAEFNMVRGSYGKGYGQYPEWGFYGEELGTNGEFARNKDGSIKEPHVVITHGNPANMPMYNAEQEMRSRILKIVKEVFSSD